MHTILVQIGEFSWTMRALHLACALSRKTGADISLLRLAPVRHIAYLGSSFGSAPPTPREYRELSEYMAIAKDYGVEFTLHRMQCFARMDAVAQAADDLNADVVFAQVPKSRVPYWQRFETRYLEQRLSAHGRQLYTLDAPIRMNDWLPSVPETHMAVPVK